MSQTTEHETIPVEVARSPEKAAEDQTHSRWHRGPLLPMTTDLPCLAARWEHSRYQRPVAVTLRVYRFFGLPGLLLGLGVACSFQLRGPQSKDDKAKQDREREDAFVKQAEGYVKDWKRDPLNNIEHALSNYENAVKVRPEGPDCRTIWRIVFGVDKPGCERCGEDKILRDKEEYKYDNKNDVEKRRLEIITNLDRYLKKCDLSPKQLKLIKESLAEHYVQLLRGAPQSWADAAQYHYEHGISLSNGKEQHDRARALQEFEIAELLSPIFLDVTFPSGLDPKLLIHNCLYLREIIKLEDETLKEKKTDCVKAASRNWKDTDPPRLQGECNIALSDLAHMLGSYLKRCELSAKELKEELTRAHDLVPMQKPCQSDPNCPCFACWPS